MNLNRSWARWRRLGALAAALLGAMWVWTACAKKPAAPAGPAGKTNTTAKASPKAASTNDDILSPDSGRPKAVFQDDPKVGRDPFFPNSERRLAHASAPESVSSGLSMLQQISLKAIFGSSPPRAWINNRSFQPGDQGMVSLPDGKKISVRCVQITDRSAVIEVEGIPGQHKISLRGVR